MILSNKPQKEIAELVASLEVTDPYFSNTRNAGFSEASEHSGKQRIIFYQLVGADFVESLRVQCQELYDQMLIDFESKWGYKMPFDYVRVDAFMDHETDQLRILEINSRNADMYETTDMIDAQLAEDITESKHRMLVDKIVANQFQLHTQRLWSMPERLLYVYNGTEQKLFRKALEKKYTNIDACKTFEDVDGVSNAGVRYKETDYRAITRKFQKPSQEFYEYDKNNQIVIMMQLQWEEFGKKGYLVGLEQAQNLTKPVSKETIRDVVMNHQDLIVKATNSGGSRAVFVGKNYEKKDWIRLLETLLLDEDSEYIYQTYLQPKKQMMHVPGQGEIIAPVQYGVYILPRLDGTNQIDIDFHLRANLGTAKNFVFDPAGEKPEIAFGSIVVCND